jgi:excisionase family DNA binding protein
MDIRAAAVYLGKISHWTVRELVWSGALPEVRIGRRLLFDVRDLDELIERSKRSEVHP